MSNRIEIIDNMSDDSANQSIMNKIQEHTNENIVGITNMNAFWIFDKTNNGLLKAWELWMKRFDIIRHYKDLKNKKEKQDNNLLKFLEKPVTYSDDVLIPLKEINHKEKIFVRALKFDIWKNKQLLEIPLLDINNFDNESDRKIVWEFNEKTKILKELWDKYSQLLFLHEDILSIEQQFIDHPSDELFNSYMIKLQYFQEEFKNIIIKDFSILQQYFQDINNDLLQIQKTVDNKKPWELIKVSCISAVVRVLSTNIIWWFITGHNPLTNPYFWALTSATMPAVVILNYLDYYYGIFSRITNLINSGLKIKS